MRIGGNDMKTAPRGRQGGGSECMFSSVAFPLGTPENSSDLTAAGEGPQESSSFGASVPSEVHHH